jgi:hypothetical protein
MMNRKQRDKNRNNSAKLREPSCGICGRKGKHYVPAFFGEDGFYACEHFDSPQSVSVPKTSTVTNDNKEAI